MTDPQRSPVLAGAPRLTIKRGTCYAIYAYDVANSIDLDAAEARIQATERQTVQQKRRAPEYFEYRPAPLRVSWGAPALTVGTFATAPVVELVMYDFGAISLSFSIPIPGSFDGLVSLAEALRGNAQLVAESKRFVEQLMETLGPVAERPRVASLVEDYEIFQLDEWDPPMDAAMLYARVAPAVAQVLRAETRTLSDQEVEQATSLRASFGPGDLTIIDTDAALVFDPDAADVRAVIEFANAQILEMRFLDQQLDAVLERSYDLLSRHNRARSVFGFRDPETWTVAQYELDATILFERVTNALKLIGEQYLTRIYGLVSRRFHLAEWDANISRKLQTLEGIYEKMATQASGRRMEILEWIIIVLIAVSILLPFMPGLDGK
ncbi:MAG: hypothetical protein HY700_18620 [Gemmatimonadetes bacterium]|nr:hypothetical protein [Gemmatimonadota bacterium]